MGLTTPQDYIVMPGFSLVNTDRFTRGWRLSIGDYKRLPRKGSGELSRHDLFCLSTDFVEWLKGYQGARVHAARLSVIRTYLTYPLCHSVNFPLSHSTPINNLQNPCLLSSPDPLRGGRL